MAGNIGRYALGSLIPFQVNLFTGMLPSRDERREFGEKLISERLSGDSRASIKVYFPIPCGVLNFRHQIMAKKPATEGES